VCGSITAERCDRASAGSLSSLAGIAGIGFTVSRFVVGLAFDDPATTAHLQRRCTRRGVWPSDSLTGNSTRAP
jgi:Na+/H+ antiporter NhaA